MSAHHRQDAANLAVGGPNLQTALATRPVADADVIVLPDVAAPHTPGAYERLVKPAIDVLGATLLLLVLSPVLLATAIGVRATLGRGIFYRQSRVGRDGEIFTMLKFRSMIHDRRGPRDAAATPAADAVGPLSFVGDDRRRTHKHPRDPRVTPFGDFIRRYSLDELPQLLNVLRGDLSLVGPRPELVGIVDRYQPWQHRRHDVKPGLTGLWQVTERDREGLMHLCVDTDLEYIRSMSLTNDVRILAMTVPAVLGLNGETARESA